MYYPFGKFNHLKKSESYNTSFTKDNIQLERQYNWFQVQSIYKENTLYTIALRFCFVVLVKTFSDFADRAFQ